MARNPSKAAPAAKKPSAARPLQVNVCKVDTSLGLVFGYAIVCKVGGEDYYDTGSADPDGAVYSDHISEDEMLAATTEFMLTARVAKEMHDPADQPRGVVVHSFPLTTEIAKALDITADKTGWLIAMKPDDAMLAKFASGELTGFSIGGTAHREKETTP